MGHPLLPANRWHGRRTWLQAAPGKVQAGHPEGFPHWKGGYASEQTVQRCGRVIIPGRFYEMYGHGTLCYAFIHMGVFGQRLDLKFWSTFQPQQFAHSIILSYSGSIYPGKSKTYMK